MKAATFLKQNRIFFIAIVVSLIWHGFWLSTLTIVAPVTKEHVKFSKVAFLGPILDRGVMEVRVKARERSFLENRYISLMYDIPGQPAAIQDYGISGNVTSSAFNRAIIRMVDDAVSGPKLEPPAGLP